MRYSDHFATQSESYSQFRPDYPEDLFQYLVGLQNNHDLVWDCATGTGQSAMVLANYFKKVIATDINQSQLDVALTKPNIEYICCPAEKTPLQNHSVDLITISQALHWFDFEKFYCEVKRVLKPKGIIAAWCYPLGSITPAVDVIIKKLYDDILGDEYWPKERRYIDKAYQTIPFPFIKFTTPEFYTEKVFTFSQFIGYLNTWSAVKEYQKRNQQNPIDLVYKDLQNAWGNLDETYIMRWPLHIMVGVC